MTRPRVFRDAITPREALLELERCAGTQFDPAVVATFKRVVQIVAKRIGRREMRDSVPDSRFVAQSGYPCQRLNRSSASRSTRSC